MEDGNTMVTSNFSLGLDVRNRWFSCFLLLLSYSYRSRDKNLWQLENRMLVAAEHTPASD